MPLDLTGAEDALATEGNFRVTIPGVPGSARFSEVSEPEVEHKVAMHWEGGRQTPHVVRTGKREAKEVTFKRGMLSSGSAFYTVFREHATGGGSNISITIEMLGADHVTILKTWNLVNGAFKGYKGPALKADTSGEVAVEEIVFQPEDLEE
jgi:phage tail-like protein